LAAWTSPPPWRPGFIAFDEGLEDQFPPTTLTDRLAFHVSLDGLSASDCQIPNLPKTQGDPRAPLFAIRTAKASCALQNRQNVTSDDLEIAAALVLGPRATMLPADQPPPEQSDQPESPREADQGADHQPNPDTKVTQARREPQHLVRLNRGRNAGDLYRLARQNPMVGNGSTSSRPYAQPHLGNPCVARTAANPQSISDPKTSMSDSIKAAATGFSSSQWMPADQRHSTVWEAEITWH